MSFNRQILQQKSGPTQLARQVTNVSADYVMRADDDVLIETAAGHIVSLPPIPALGDTHEVIAQGGALTLSGNGFLVNGAASIGLVQGDQASVTWNGAAWDATIANPNPSGGGGGQANVILANGLNSNVATQGQAVVRIGGPTAAYSIDGFALPVAAQGGDRFVLVNTVLFPLTIVNEGTGSLAGNRVQTLRQVAITLPTAGSSCAFVFDGTANRWVLEHIGTRMPFEFNVRDFGAMGDGVTDDSAAIQAAINAAGAVGGVVFFPVPSVVYAHATTLTVPSGVTLHGAGYQFYSAVHANLKGVWLKWIGPAGASTAVPNTQLVLFDVNNVKVSHLGLLGNSVAFVNGIQLDSDNTPATFQVTIEDVTFAEHAVGSQVGPYGVATDDEVDMLRFSDVYWVNYSDTGIRINSVNAADNSIVGKCRWFSAAGLGSGTGASCIDLVRTGTLTVEAAAFGSDIGIKLFGSFANCVTIINSQLEPPATWFLKLTGGSMEAPVTLINNTINVGVYLGGFCRIVGLGNNYTSATANITLDSSGAYYAGFGEVLDTTSPGVSVLAGGSYTNHNVGDPTFYHPVSLGAIEWPPQAQSGFLNVAGEKITRTGQRAPLWAALTPYVTGNLILPKTTDNGHVYQAQNNGTSAAGEPVFPTGAGATVVDGTVTWKEFGAAFKAASFGPLGHDASTAPPVSGYWPVGAIRWNTVPGTVTGAPVGWINTVAGNPGTWVAFGNVGTLFASATSLTIKSPALAGFVTVEFDDSGIYGWLSNQNGLELFSPTPDFGNGVGVLGMLYATTPPNANPTTGFILWTATAAFQARSKNGVVEQIARDSTGTANLQHQAFRKLSQVGQTTAAGQSVSLAIIVDTSAVTHYSVKVSGRVTVAGGTASQGDFFVAAYYDVSVSCDGGGTVTIVTDGGTPVPTKTANSTSQAADTVTFVTGASSLTINANQIGGTNSGTIDWQINVESQVN